MRASDPCRWELLKRFTEDRQVQIITWFIAIAYPEGLLMGLFYPRKVICS